jgi:hypothetical protein
LFGLSMAVVETVGGGEEGRTGGVEKKAKPVVV